MKIAGKIEPKQLFARCKNSNYLLPLVATAAVFVGFYYRFLSLFFFSDDFHHLLVNKSMALVDSFKFSTQAFANPNLYRPTTNLFFSINEKLFGLNPAPYFFELFIIGLLTSLLVYILLFRITSNKFVSFVVAAFFTLSPIRIDPLSWSANICDSLLGLFAVLALIAASYYTLSKRKIYLASVFCLLVLALLSKESAIALVVAVGVMLLPTLRKENIPSRLVVAASVFIPFFSYFVLRVGYSLYIKTHLITTSYKDFAMSSVVKYIRTGINLSGRLFLLPTDLGLLYKGGLVAAVYILLAVPVIFLKNKIHYIVGYMLMILSIVPALTVDYVFDRYLYLSLLGLCICIAVVLSEITLVKKDTLGLLLIAATIFAGAITYQRVEMVIAGSNYSREFVSSLSGANISSIALVPSSYGKTIYGHWNYNQLIISEQSHPNSISRLFYKSSHEITVLSNSVPTSPTCSISLQGKLFNGDGIYFDAIANDLLVKENKVQSYYDCTRVVILR
jgi:hypothetical protein